MAEKTPMEHHVKEDISKIASFDPAKKKKKKKKIHNVSDGVESESLVGSGRRKKNPLAKADFFDGSRVDLEADVFGEDEEEGEVSISRDPWEGSEGDYQYEQLLGRFFNILRENNPELAGDRDRHRTVLRSPEVLQEGTRKTVFVNFRDLCKTMHRPPEHFMTFLLMEIETSGSLDGQERLVVNGRFASKHIEAILWRYINEYVMCNTCKSPDTILTRENSLVFLRCDQCGSERSVAPISAGLFARVERRKSATCENYACK